MWKAILVLFVTSSTNPMATMIGQFPETFATKSECQQFVAAKRGQITGSSVEIAPHGSPERVTAEVVHHELDCVQDRKGMKI